MGANPVHSALRPQVQVNAVSHRDGGPDGDASGGGPCGAFWSRGDVGSPAVGSYSRDGGLVVDRNQLVTEYFANLEAAGAAAEVMPVTVEN